MIRTVTDVLTVDGQPVEITYLWPPGVNIVNLQELAEKAWRSPAKSVTTEDGVVMKVRAIRDRQAAPK